MRWFGAKAKRSDTGKMLSLRFSFIIFIKIQIYSHRERPVTTKNRAQEQHEGTSGYSPPKGTVHLQGLSAHLPRRQDAQESTHIGTRESKDKVDGLCRGKVTADVRRVELNVGPL